MSESPRRPWRFTVCCALPTSSRIPDRQSEVAQLRPEAPTPTKHSNRKAMPRLDLNKKKRRGGRSDSPYSVFHGGVAQYLSTRSLLLRRVFV
jgi:hypothetical protein